MDIRSCHNGMLRLVRRPVGLCPRIVPLGKENAVETAATVGPMVSASVVIRCQKKFGMSKRTTRLNVVGIGDDDTQQGSPVHEPLPRNIGPRLAILVAILLGFPTGR